MVSGATRVAGLLGDPVDHSRSPAMHNAAYAALGLDWVYVPLPTPVAQLAAALRGLAALGFAGANVTIPHKEVAAGLCEALSPEAARARSVNTILVRDGGLHGETTDGAGLLDAVAGAGRTASLGRDALVLGAGGAARAAAVALLDAGVRSLAVAARREEAARGLVEALAALAPGADVRAAAWPPGPAALVVNATPIGQREDAAPPLDLAGLPAGSLVCDLAYRADGSPTRLVREAAAGGVAVVDGLDVLVCQGARAFALLTGREAPVEVMRRAARRGA